MKTQSLKVRKAIKKLRENFALGMSPEESIKQLQGSGFDTATLLTAVQSEIFSMIQKRKAVVNAPEPGKQYALTGGSNQKSISNGNTWAESEIKHD